MSYRGPRCHQLHQSSASGKTPRCLNTSPNLCNPSSQQNCLEIGCRSSLGLPPPFCFQSGQKYQQTSWSRDLPQLPKRLSPLGFAAECLRRGLAFSAAQQGHFPGPGALVCSLRSARLLQRFCTVSQGRAQPNLRHHQRARRAANGINATCTLDLGNKFQRPWRGEELHPRHNAPGGQEGGKLPCAMPLVLSLPRQRAQAWWSANSSQPGGYRQYPFQNKIFGEQALHVREGRSPSSPAGPHAEYPLQKPVILVAISTSSINLPKCSNAQTLPSPISAEL